MKKSIFLMMVCLFASAQVFAYDYAVDGIYYNFDDATMTATVTYQESGMANYQAYSGNVVIPDSVQKYGYGDWYKVITIGSNAFEYCNGITSVIIPRSVISIGSDIFNGIGFRVSYYSGSYHSTPNSSKLKSITIPENVTYIGARAFSGSEIEHVTWLAKNCTIGGSIFGDDLKDILFGKDVESIPDEFLKDNDDISQIIIPHKVKTIGARAFQNCTKLTQLALGASVEYIGSLAFQNCYELSHIICYAENPPVVEPYSFLDVPLDATVEVPCGLINLYAAADEWKYFWDFTETIVYKASALSADDTQGVASCTQTCAEATFVAEPMVGFKFKSWSNGLTENPLTLPLTEDVELTAEFAPETTALEFVGADGVVITTEGNQINISGCEEMVTVFDFSGRMVYQGYDKQISVPSAGLYLVQTANETQKVMIQ